MWKKKIHLTFGRRARGVCGHPPPAAAARFFFWCLYNLPNVPSVPGIMKKKRDVRVRYFKKKKKHIVRDNIQDLIIIFIVCYIVVVGLWWCFFFQWCIWTKSILSGRIKGGRRRQGRSNIRWSDLINKKGREEMGRGGVEYYDHEWLIYHELAIKTYKKRKN